MDREQLKCYPELMALIEQEHTLEQVEKVSFFQNIGGYVDEHGFPRQCPVGPVETTITFTDGTKIMTDKPISYVPKREEEDEQEEASE